MNMNSFIKPGLPVLSDTVYDSHKLTLRSKAVIINIEFIHFLAQYSKPKVGVTVKF